MPGCDLQSYLGSPELSMMPSRRPTQIALFCRGFPITVSWGRAVFIENAGEPR